MTPTGRVLTIQNQSLKNIVDNLNKLSSRTDTLKGHQEDIDTSIDSAEEKYTVLVARLDGQAALSGKAQDVENHSLEIIKKMPKLEEACDIASAGFRATADAQQDVIKQANDCWLMSNIQSGIKVDATTIDL